MNFTNSGHAWRGSNPYWFKRIRTFIALRLVAGGNRLADWAEWVAPWVRKPDPAPARRPPPDWGATELLEDPDQHDPMRGRP